jgi:hypothetical protein
MKIHRQTWKVLGACALAAAAAACGSSSPSSSSSTPPPASPSATTPSSTTSSSGGAANATIAANWVAFFDAKTPVSKRVSLLEDGSQFQSIIATQAHQSLPSLASAKVISVSNVTASNATVKYDILVSGTPALTNEIGTAVYQDGTWKVGVSSFCGLLSLEGLKSMPAACSSAG